MTAVDNLNEHAVHCVHHIVIIGHVQLLLSRDMHMSMQFAVQMALAL